MEVVQPGGYSNASQLAGDPDKCRPSPVECVHVADQPTRMGSML